MRLTGIERCKAQEQLGTEGGKKLQLQPNHFHNGDNKTWFSGWLQKIGPSLVKIRIIVNP